MRKKFDVIKLRKCFRNFDEFAFQWSMVEYFCLVDKKVYLNILFREIQISLKFSEIIVNKFFYLK